MKIGALATAHCLVGESSADAYQRWFDLATTAEDQGYWSFWTTQHHFGSERDYRPYGRTVEEWPTVDYDLAPDPLTLLTFLAGKTTRIRLGTAVAVLHWDHPIRLAEQAAMLDVLSGGRLEMAVGRGSGFREPGVFDVPTSDDANRRKFTEAIEVIRRAWTGETFSFDGEFFQFPELIMVPKPTRQPAPLWVGSHSEHSAAYAARAGLPYACATWPFEGVELQKGKLARYREEAAQAGVDISSFDIPHFQFMYCAETDEEAEAIGSHYMTEHQYILEAHYQHTRHQDEPGLFGADARKLIEVDSITQSALDDQLIGTPETLIRRIQAYKAEVDFNYLVLNIGWGNMPHEKSIGSLRRFAQEVAPHLSDVPAMLDA